MTTSVNQFQSSPHGWTFSQRLNLEPAMFDICHSIQNNSRYRLKAVLKERICAHFSLQQTWAFPWAGYSTSLQYSTIFFLSNESSTKVINWLNLQWNLTWAQVLNKVLNLRTTAYNKFSTAWFRHKPQTWSTRCISTMQAQFNSSARQPIDSQTTTSGSKRKQCDVVVSLQLLYHLRQNRQCHRDTVSVINFLGIIISTIPSPDEEITGERFAAKYHHHRKDNNAF